MVIDALARQESCGCHFNEAFQTEEHEARRDDDNFCHVAVWEYAGDGKDPIFHKEPLVFENVKLATKELQVSTVHQSHPESLAAEQARGQRASGNLYGQGYFHGHVLSGDARHRQ